MPVPGQRERRQVGRKRAARRLGGDLRARREIQVAPVGGAEQNEIAVVDDGREEGVAHRIPAYIRGTRIWIRAPPSMMDISGVASSPTSMRSSSRWSSR